MLCLSILSQSVRLKIWKLSQYLAITLLLCAVVPVVGAQTQDKSGAQQVSTGTTLMASTSEAEDDAWIRVNKEPREMSGIVIGAIIVNLTLVVIFFRLLLREWYKHRAINNPAPVSQAKK